MVELAIVLVVLGLLVGAVLKGRELVAGARVRDLVTMAAETQAAYLGFLDRYNRVPGDWHATAASAAIGETVNG